MLSCTGQCYEIKEEIGGRLEDKSMAAWVHKHAARHGAQDCGQRRQSGTGPMICSYYQGLRVMLPCLVASCHFALRVNCKKLVNMLCVFLLPITRNYLALLVICRFPLSSEQQLVDAQAGSRREGQTRVDMLVRSIIRAWD